MSSSNLARQLLGLMDDLRRPARRKHVAHAVHFLETILDLVEQRVIRYSTHRITNASTPVIVRGEPPQMS